MNKFLNKEVLAIIFGIFGVIVGVYLPGVAKGLSFLGEIFILLLKMLIIPLVFTSIFLSITKLPFEQLKNLGLKTILYYIFTSSMACLVGLLVACFVITPEFSIETLKLSEVSNIEGISFNQFITSFFSGNFFEALSQGNIVQIVVFTILVSLASLKLDQKSNMILVNFLEAIQKLMTIIINWILILAPIGIFSLVASIVASTELQAFEKLIPLFLGISGAVIVHVFVTLFLIAKFFGKFNLFKFILKVKKALVVAITTASSTASLPISNEVLTKEVGVSKKTSGFILPLGATLNMDGSALYQSLVIIFLGHFSGMDLGLYQQFLIFFFVMTSSAGTAGIPGGGLMMMGAVMGMVGIPMEYIGIYLLIDRFWDYPITMVNVLGDLVGAKTIDRYIK